MKAIYEDPESNKVQSVDVADYAEVDRILTTLAGRQASDPQPIGTSTVVLDPGDGSSLMVAQTHAGFVLGYQDQLGSSVHSVGTGTGDEIVAFNHLGEWNEVPSHFAVPEDVARAATKAYIETGSPDVAGLIWEPD